MNLHNIMEEEVIARVEESYNDEKIIGAYTNICNCEQCKLDTTAYVLNRIKPRYIISERGIVHAVSEQGSQLEADIKILIIDAIKKIHNLRRASHAKASKTKNESLDIAFNFPIFSGLILDGSTFEPIKSAKVTLKMDEHTVEMFDITWQNPYIVTNATNGTFAFWVESIKSNAIDKTEIFNFSVTIEAEQYETTKYAFPIEITSDDIHNKVPQTASKYRLDDLYLFPLE